MTLTPPDTAQLVVAEPGLATTVQDAGRPGFARLGVPPSGWLDPSAAQAVNRLVGNPAEAAVLETAGGLSFTVTVATVVADSVRSSATVLRPGESYTVPSPSERRWAYCSVGGGIAVAAVLGSRSTDTLSGLGPPPIGRGDRLALGVASTPTVWPDVARGPMPNEPRVSAGPRSDWFTEQAWNALAGPWEVTAVSRIGARLSGPTLNRSIDMNRELPSEGLISGAIQVPPDGQPIVMLADHPTTGGYPVIGVVHPDDIAAVAQWPDGRAMRFRTR